MEWKGIMTENAFIATYGREARVKHTRLRFRFHGATNWWTEYFVDLPGHARADDWRRKLSPFAEIQDVGKGVMPLPD